MKLYVLRHGEAQTVASSDAERGLTVHGEAQVRTIASFYSKNGDQIDHIVSSPYKRAKQTAAIFKEVAGIGCDIKENSNITPDIPLSRAVKDLDKFFTGNLLMVSHQPLVSGLISYLVWGESSPRVGMDTASLACLEADMLQAGAAELVWIEHVNDIR